MTSYIHERRVCWVACEDVGAVAAAALREPEKHRGQTYRLGADVRSHSEIAALFSRCSGEPFEVEHCTPDDFLERMVHSGGNEAYFRCIQNQFTRNIEGSFPGADQLYGDFPSLLGRPALSWEAFVQKHADALFKRVP